MLGMSKEMERFVLIICGVVVLMGMLANASGGSSNSYDRGGYGEAESNVSDYYEMKEWQSRQ